MQTSTSNSSASSASMMPPVARAEGNDTQTFVNITVTVADPGASQNASQHVEDTDATAPNTSPLDPTTYVPPPLNPSASPIEPNKKALVLQTYSDVQLSNTNSALFGGLTALGAVVLYKAWIAYKRRPKPIYLLNGLQTSLLFIKTLSATFYAVMVSGSLNCKARSPLMNIPMVLAWDMIYGIMLLKLLLFTEWKRTVMVVIPLGALTHFAIVVAGIVMRKSGITNLGLCTDKYPILFKHQYDVELFLEVFLTGILLHGIASKKSGVFAGTKEVFRQLQFNEHTRVFFAIIFVSLKIVFAYGKFKVPTALTHGIDSARSAVVSWALTREVHSPAKKPAGPPARGPSFKGGMQQRQKSLLAKAQRTAEARDGDSGDDDGLSGDSVDGGIDDIPGFNFSGDIKHRVSSNADMSKDTVAARSAGDLV